MSQWDRAFEFRRAVRVAEKPLAIPRERLQTGSISLMEVWNVVIGSRAFCRFGTGVIHVVFFTVLLGFGAAFASETDNLGLRRGQSGVCGSSDQIVARSIVASRQQRESQNYDQAMVFAKQAVEAVREGEVGLPDLARALSNQASLYRLRGAYDEAATLYQRAIKIREKHCGADHLETAQSLNSLAALFKDIGEYSKAESFFKRALEIRKRHLGATNLDTATTVNNLAGLYEILGAFEQAEVMYQESLDIFRSIRGWEHPETARSLNNLAWVHVAMGHYERAELLYREALTIVEKAYGSAHRDVARALNNLGRLYFDRGDAWRAKSLFERSLSIREQILGPDHPIVAGSLGNLAETYLAMGEHDEASARFRRALQILSAGTVPDALWRVQYGLSRLGAARGNQVEAIFFGKQAVNTLQGVRARNSALDDAMQKSFLEKNEATYKSLADLLFAEGRLMEGQQVLAMLKEAEYFDFVQRSCATDPRKTQAGYTEQERPWSERYEQISGQLAAMGKEREALQKKAKSAGGGEGAALSAAEQTRKDQLDADLILARQAYDAFMVELKREFSQSASGASAQRQQELGEKNLASLRALQGTLRDLALIGKSGTVTLHYLMTDKRLWILLTTPSIQLKREAAISEAELNRLIGQYREAIANRDPQIKVLGKALYDLLIAPVADDLQQAGAQTLMLSLDGALRYLPMAALHDGERYLAQRYRLALYTSAAQDKLKDKPQANWTLAGYGLTQAHEHFSALPSVKGELDGILEGMKGEVKFDQAFTAQAFKNGLEGEPPVVHLASHFVFKSGNETDSFLLLGDGNKLSLKAIKEGYEFINLDLLTLSACETAVGGGKDANGREVEGFGALAQNQGAKGVIATLWPVADQSTGQFMQLFYGFRQKTPGTTKAEAMQLAQQAFIEGRVGPALAEVSRGLSRAGVEKGATKTAVSTDHPYFWAPFILMGNWL